MNAPSEIAIIHSAVIDGGGVPLALTRNPTNRNAVTPANAHVPILSRGVVALAYIQTPMANITVSVTSVAVTKFHRPSPNFGPPGIKRQIGNMRDDVEHPVADHEQEHDDGGCNRCDGCDGCNRCNGCDGVRQSRGARRRTAQPKAAPKSVNVRSECEYG